MYPCRASKFRKTIEYANDKAEESICTLLQTCKKELIFCLLFSTRKWTTTRSFWRSSSRGYNHTTTSTFGIRTSAILKWNVSLRIFFFFCNKISGFLTCFFTSVILIFGARGKSLHSTCFDFSRLSFLHENTQQEAEQCLKMNLLFYNFRVKCNKANRLTYKIVVKSHCCCLCFC